VKSSFYTITLKDLRISLKDLSAILQMVSYVMLLPLGATLYFRTWSDIGGFLSEASAFLVPAFILYGLYVIFRGLEVEAPARTKNIMMTVALAWMVIAVVGAIPFVIRGTFGPVDALFESMSGWTTTGFSMLQDFEGTSRDIMLYRGIMEGVGGLGVISLGLMVMMQGSTIALGYSDVGIQKIKPGIRHTIVESWKVYGLYILLGVVLLNIAGMSPFDAVNHSMAAVATGGFSTHADIGYYDSLPIELVLILLMVLGMTSFIVHYRLFNGEASALKGEETRYFAIVVVAAVAVISVSVLWKDIPGVDTHSIFDVVRKTGFHVISGMSTSGFNTVDFGKWPDFAKTALVGLMYVGGMSSSTAGGIRVIRFLILLKAVHYGLKRLVLPKTAMVVMKVDGRPLREDIIAVVGYSAVYLSVCVLLGMGLMLFGYRALDSVFTIMSAMGNAGLGVLSGDGWFSMPDLGKLIVVFAMWVGRIEIYPGLLILRALLDRARLM
jgi:trk system potassium uptake protein